MEQLSPLKRRRSAAALPAGTARIAAAPLLVGRQWIAPRTWRATANLALWAAAAYLVVAVTLAGLALSLLTVWVTGLGVAVRASVLRALAATVGADRRRIDRLSGIPVAPIALPPVDPDATFLERQRSWGDAPWLWRLPLYELICTPFVTAMVAATIAWWWATVACVVLIARRSRLVVRPIDVLGLSVGPWRVSWIGAVAMGLVCVAGVALWPYAVRLLSAIEAALARWLLGPSPSELSREVVRLSQTRVQAVAAADAERRRIERDLHDGFQPQLVNLALNLGLARSRLAHDPDAARSLLERAHDDAKRAAADLRNLVRGIHPSVLDERGLDAAFSALAASSSVPVQIDVHLDRRPPRAAEAIAYFVVAEAVTNISKHARAGSATVTVSEVAGALWVLVQDDGRGGARLEPGGGLTGLAARIAAVDGTFSLTSPDGGPTWVEATIPCG